jgi:hypothetical protein
VQLLGEIAIELERQIEKKTANQLGDSQEVVDLAQELSQAFREDVVQRVASRQG